MKRKNGQRKDLKKMHLTGRDNPFAVIYVRHNLLKRKHCVTSHSPTPRRVENTTRRGIFLTSVEVFGDVVKHCFECLIYLLN